MKSSPNENSMRHSIITIKLTIIGIIITIISIIIGLYLEKPELLKSITSWFMISPFFWGVIFSWLVAVLSTLLVLWLTYSVKKEEYSRKKKQYSEVFKQSEMWLRGITVGVLFYLAIHLASKAFWPIGIPIFSQSYDRLDFLQHISPQDIFLSSFVVLIIIFLFAIAPHLNIRKFKYTIPVFIFLAFIIAVCIIIFLPPVVHVNESVSEPHQMPGSYLFRLNAELEDDLNNSVISVGLKNSFKTAEFELSENASVRKEKENEWVITDKEKFIVRKEDNALNVYRYPPVFLFFISLVVSLLFFVCRFIFNVLEIPKGIKSDFGDLLLIFCFIPAIIVASLVLAGNELVKLPNFFGNIVVGLVFISGFATLLSIVTISFKQETVPFPLWNPVWLVSTFASLATISFFSMVFLLLRPLLQIDIFGKVLLFSVAIMILILLYGFLYEKLRKYHFTEWWRRKWRPIVMIISIVLIAIVSAIDPYTLWVWEIPSKLVWIAAVLVIGFCLPGLIMGFRRLLKGTWFRKLLKGQIPKPRMNFMNLPMHQGMVLVKAKTDPGSLKEVVKGLDGMEGVYQTMVVRGEYDVCLIVEGVDYYDIEKKILEIRKIDGVANTTTLRDVREFFDREVK